MSLKILIISDNPYSSTDYGNQVRNVFCRLDPSDFNVTVVAPNTGGVQQPFKAGNAKVYPVLNNGYGNVSVLRESLQIIKPDIVLMFTDINAVQYVFNISNEIRSRAKLIVYDALESSLINKAYTTYRAEIDDFVTYTRRSQSLLNTAGIESTYIPFGINTDEFKLLTDDEHEKFKKQVLQEELKDVVTFLWHGINNSRNRVLDVVHAFEKAYKQNNKIALMMLFQGYEADYTPIQNYIMDYAPRLPIVVDEQANSRLTVNAHYYMADAYVSIPTVSKFEFGALRALATGRTPMLSSTVGADDIAAYAASDDDYFSAKVIPTITTSLTGVEAVPYAMHNFADKRMLSKWMAEFPHKANVTTATGGYREIIDLINKYHKMSIVQNAWSTVLKEIAGKASTVYRPRVSVFKIKGGAL
jgi:glycosyltransferase involved in cell wall biosynthesis